MGNRSESMGFLGEEEWGRGLSAGRGVQLLVWERLSAGGGGLWGTASSVPRMKRRVGTQAGLGAFSLALTSECRERAWRGVHGTPLAYTQNPQRATYCFSVLFSDPEHQHYNLHFTDEHNEAQGRLPAQGRLGSTCGFPLPLGAVAPGWPTLEVLCKASATPPCMAPSQPGAFQGTSWVPHQKDPFTLILSTG